MINMTFSFTVNVVIFNLRKFRDYVIEMLRIIAIFAIKAKMLHKYVMV